MSNKINILARINFSRKIIGQYLENGFLNSSDIEQLFNKNNILDNYLNNLKNYKFKILQNIYISPFLLCDQECLNKSVKKRLPEFLRYRYNMEKNELEYLLENGSISNDEYLNYKEMLKFCYYQSSNEGQNILKNRGKIYVKKK